MTLKFPSTGYGMSAPSAQTSLMNKLAASNNASAGTSSWKMPTSSSFPSLKGATGNNLYPAPKAATSYPSVSAYTGKLTAPSTSSFFPKLTGATGNTLYPAPKTSSSGSSGYPSLSSYFPTATKQPGGITGGAGQAPTWSFPSASGGSPSSTASFFQNLSMPQGFSSGALGSSAPAQPPAAAPRAPQAAPVRPAAAPKPAAAASSGYGMSAPSAQTNTINKLAQQNNAVNANAQKFGGPPKGAGRYATLEEAAYHSGMTNGNITGDKTMMSQHMFDTKPGTNGTYGVYPRGQASQPVTPPPVIVGRPTQGHQPVSTPVIAPRPSAWAPPPMTQEEIIEAQQGGWLS